MFPKERKNDKNEPKYPFNRENKNSVKTGLDLAII